MGPFGQAGCRVGPEEAQAPGTCLCRRDKPCRPVPQDETCCGTWSRTECERVDGRRGDAHPGPSRVPVSGSGPRVVVCRLPGRRDITHLRCMFTQMHEPHAGGQFPRDGLFLTGEALRTPKWGGNPRTTT